MKKIVLFFCIAAAALISAASPAPKAAPASSITPPNLKMMLPEIVYAVPGIESNIYFENAIDSATPKAYSFEVRCARGKQGNTRWYWTPDKKDAGKKFDLELRLFNDRGVVLSGKCQVVVAGEPADYNRKLTLALLADSGVNCNYPAFLLEVMRKTGFKNYTPVGSHAGFGKPVVPGGIAHDGYGGYAWDTFLSRWAFAAEELKGIQDKAELAQMKALGVRNVPKASIYRYRSPLLTFKNGKRVLDIPGWFKRVNRGKAPDYIIIQLGGNDVFGCRSHNLETRVANVLKRARTLLAALRKHAPNAVIAVSTQPCGCSQDGFGENYGCGQSKYQFRRNIQFYNRAITAFAKELKDPKLKLIPLHHVVDPDNSYIRGWRKVHARGKKAIVRDINALHPTYEGGKQMADAIYCWLRKELEK